MTTTEPNATVSLGTSQAPGAIAAIHISGDYQTILSHLGSDPVAPGTLSLRNIAGIDTAIIAAISEHAAIITPHGGPAIVSAILSALQAAGAQRHDDDPRTLYPEAQDEVEALALHALSRAASPRAVNLLLDQPKRWREHTQTPPDEIERVSAKLNHLIFPPTVVTVGRPNIGKSTLLNALAGRTVSVVADEPGVTRDHVGALLELDGLTVRWIDAPGIRPPESDAEARAIKLANDLIKDADLLLSCTDPTTPAIDTDSRALPLCLRADLGTAPAGSIAVSSATKAGLSDLAKAVRSALVPDQALAWPGPWRFDPRLPASR